MTGVMAKIKVGVCLAGAAVVVGCIAPGPQLSISRDTGTTPTSGPTGRPAGTVGTEVPPLTGNHQILGLGGVEFGSTLYHGFGTTSFVYGGQSSGDHYRMVGPELSLGGDKIKDQK